MATNRPIPQDMKCTICGDLKKKPRVTRCGHSFCTECLERKLQESSRDGSRKREIKFKCPGQDCEREFIFPDGSIENFSPNLDLERLIEAEKLRNKDAFCRKHSEVCGLFCLDCNRELCNQCLEDHDRHQCRTINKAIQFYVEKCLEKDDSAQDNCKELNKKSQKVTKFLSDEERKMESILERTVNLFQWTESKTREQEVSSVTGILQELEFLGPSRKKMELEKKRSLYEYVTQIIRQILSNPGKSVIEPVRVLELAEHTFKRAEEIHDIQDSNIKMKKSLSESNKIGQKFLVSLQKSFNPENYSLNWKFSSQFEGYYFLLANLYSIKIFIFRTSPRSQNFTIQLISFSNISIQSKLRQKCLISYLQSDENAGCIGVLIIHLKFLKIV